MSLLDLVPKELKAGSAAYSHNHAHYSVIPTPKRDKQPACPQFSFGGILAIMMIYKIKERGSGWEQRGGSAGNSVCFTGLVTRTHTVEGEGQKVGVL